MNICELKKKVSPYIDRDYPVFFMSKYIYRNISIVFTYLFHKTKISANQVSFLMLLIGLSGSIAFFYNKMVLGIILMHFWYAFDFVDGEIARLKNQSSLTGAYLDHLIHYVNHPAFFIGISFGIYSILKWKTILIFGFSAAFFELIDRASQDTFMMVYYKNMIKNKCFFVETEYKPLKFTVLNFIKSNLRFPNIMYVFTISIVVDLITMLFLENRFYITSIILVIYGTLVPIIIVISKFKKVASFELDKKIQEKIELSSEGHQ